MNDDKSPRTQIITATVLASDHIIGANSGISF